MQAEGRSLSLSLSHTHAHTHTFTHTCMHSVVLSLTLRQLEPESWRLSGDMAKHVCVSHTKEPPNCLGFINAAAFQLQPKLSGKKKKILVAGREVYSHRLQNNCIINTGGNSFFMVKKWRGFWMLSRHEGDHIWRVFYGYMETVCNVCWYFFSVRARGFFFFFLSTEKRRGGEKSASYQRCWGWIPVLRGSGPGCS